MTENIRCLFLVFLTLIPYFGKCILEANKEINKCCLSFEETCNKRPYVRVQKLLGGYKANAVDEPEQYPEEEEEEEGDLIRQ